MAKNWYYEKYNPETGEVKRCPLNDLRGSITGRVVIDVPTWFDEHPDERIARGWVKHIMGSIGDLEYNPQTQYLITTTQVIDEYTVKDVYIVMDKSEDQMMMEEMLEGISPFLPNQSSGGVWISGQYTYIDEDGQFQVEATQHE